MMVSKKPSAFTLLKEKKLAGTLTASEMKKYKKLKKEKRERRLNKTNASTLDISLDDTIAPVVESPKKRKKENPPATQEIKAEAPVVTSSDLPSAQAEPDESEEEEVAEPAFKEEEVAEPVLDPHNEAMTAFIQSQYKAVQAMMVDVEKMAALYNVELVEAAVKPVVVVRGSKVLKMSNFMVWRDRHDLTGLTMEQKKEKWGAVPDDEKKLFAVEARKINKQSGWDAKKVTNGPKRKINAYTAFCSLQIKENKKKMTECGVLWKTLTDEEKQQYQKIADKKNKATVKLHNPDEDKNVILNKEE